VAATPSRTSKDESLREIVRSLALEPEQVAFMEHRWLDQAVWMNSRANRARTRYYALRITTILGGVIVPALVAINEDWAHVAAGVISVLVALSAALEEFFHYGERWRHYRLTAEQLKGDGWRFMSGLSADDSPERRTSSFERFAAKIEGVIRRDVEVYVSRIVRDAEEPGEPTGAPGGHGKPHTGNSTS
jgi:uncharacterized protein DUF4231